jgi:hypothetical protein
MPRFVFYLKKRLLFTKKRVFFIKNENPQPWAIQRAKKSQQACISHAPSRCGGEKTVLWSLGRSEKNFAGGKIDHYNKQPTDVRKALLEKALTLSLLLPSLKHRLLYAGDIDAFSPLPLLLF